MILREHGRHRIVFGGKFKKREIIRIGAAHARVGARWKINVRKFIHQRIHFQGEIFKRKGLRIIQLALRIRRRRIAVKNTRANIGILRGQPEIDRIRRRTHGKEKAAARHIIFNRPRHRAFQFRHFVESHPFGHVFIFSDLLLIPRRGVETGVETAELSGKIFVMQVQPIVFLQFTVEHFFIPNRFVRNFRVRQRQRHGIIPDLFVLRRVNDDGRRFFEHHHFHVAGFDVGVNLRGFAAADGCEGHATHPALAFELSLIIHQKRAAAIIQQPLDRHAVIECPIRHAVRFEMVGLLEIHVDQQLLAPGRRGEKQAHAEEKCIMNETTHR
ncbi:MAG: hypothetical protein ALAOOOJD_03129 [bacterium]|nr:hypothetical protein [bacterium]